MARTREPVRIGARFRALRNEAGLTQAEVAEAVGVAPETMSRIERGRLQPSTDLVSRLAKAIGVEPGALFTSSSVKPKMPSVRPVDRRLLQLVRELPEPLVEDVIRGVRLLVDVGRQAPEGGRRHR
jgi:transcriptional regulator with XRE-family HTH domain